MLDDDGVDVDQWIARVRHIAAFTPSVATLDDLEAVAPDLNAVAGWVASVRSQCASRRMQLVNEAAEQRQPIPDHGDPDAGHARGHNRSRRSSEKDRERASTMDRFPALRRALEAGSISVEHVDIVTSRLRDLTEQQRLTIYEHGADLAVIAVANSPERFREALMRLMLRLIEEDGIARFERQRRNTQLRMWVGRDDGMVYVSGRYDPERGSIVSARLQAELDILYALPTPEGCPDDPIAKNDYLRALAFLRLVQAGQASFSDSPGAGPDTATIDMVVVVDLKTIACGKHDHSIIDAGLPVELPVETLRRMACCANIIPAVLNSDGVLLDLGRSTRLANRSQRRALRSMYPTCAVTGCDRRFDVCKIHHIKWWTRDCGPTDLWNLLPLCERHHHAAHEGRWMLALDPVTRVLTVTYPDGSITEMPPPRRGWSGRNVDDERRAATSARPVEPEPPPDLTLWAS